MPITTAEHVVGPPPRPRPTVAVGDLALVASLAVQFSLRRLCARRPAGIDVPEQASPHSRERGPSSPVPGPAGEHTAEFR
ncbi:hypothetical protein ABTY98_36675 [Streptomyces sp. NPDC096040]|uniref:hypothetical protein n=1 Tax=Streptomyces sp. NPDC096040 TaxID=3155541 RepID=UPI003328C1D1